MFTGMVVAFNAATVAAEIAVTSEGRTALPTAMV
jgi:hypothetical protein